MTDAISQVAGHLRNRPISRLTIVGATALAEALVMALCLWFFVFSMQAGGQFAALQAGGLAIAVALLVSAVTLLSGGYRPVVLASLTRSALRGVLAVALLGVLAFFVGLARDPFLTWTLQAWVSWALLSVAPFVILFRVLVRTFVVWAKSFGALERRAVIAGGGEPAERVIRNLAECSGNDIRVVAIFDDRDDERTPQQSLGVPNIGRFNDVLRFVDSAEIDLVLITLPLEAEERINWILSTFKSLPHEIHLVEFADDYSFDRGGDLGFVLARGSSFDIVRRWKKRGFDLLFGSVALFCLAPLMALAALAIRLDTPGPVFFTQWRHGFANRAIPVLKFRSMYHDHQDHAGTNVVKRGGDPRVTRVGAFLRKTSIDELPQLLCVLKGDLSLVGPRPHALDARSSREEPFANLVEDYASRHRLPPGVTGWAQINGFRGGIDESEQLQKRVSYDLHYIENWSLWFDLRILLRTPLALLNTRNAY